MQHALAFLHTAEVHVETFGALCAELAPELQPLHLVRPALLEDARREGLSSHLRARIAAAVANADARVVVCTCSTIGGVVEEMDTDDRFTAMRIDRAMADAAVRRGRRVAVLAALASTLEPTRLLLQESARRAGVQVALEEVLVEGAWPLFEQGDRDGYIAAIAKTLARCRDVDAIVLAQASMAPAALQVPAGGIPVFSSPRLGVAAAVAQVRAQQAGQ